jgi:transposase InsO family protein
MPYDNAVMESFFSSLKQELTHHEHFVDRDKAFSKVFDHIEVFYNENDCIVDWTTARPHSSSRWR